MTSKHKSEDFKLSAVEYYLVGDKSQLEVCKRHQCYSELGKRCVIKT